MSFSWEVDNVSRIDHSACFPDEHLSRADCLSTTSLGIGVKVIRPGLLELHSNAFAHKTVAVDSIDEGFDVSLEEITCIIQDFTSTYRLRGFRHCYVQIGTETNNSAIP